VAGATVTPGWSLAPITADGNGVYQLADAKTPTTLPYPITISADGMISRDVYVNWAVGSRTGIDVTLIHDVPPFSMDFYRQLVRGTFDDPKAPWPVLRWTRAPSFYIRTVDEDGNPLAQGVVDAIVDGINRAVPAYTGGQYTAAAIEAGTDARAQRINWVNVDVKKNSDPGSRKCGESFVGDNPGQITLWENVCACAVIPGEVVVHEVGHALGFFHVNDRTSVLFPTDVQPCPNTGILSAAERYHATIAYSRPRGNTDPDKDPSGAATALAAWNPHIRLQ
jgi:Astacin (Peptidase family M12A)